MPIFPSLRWDRSRRRQLALVLILFCSVATNHALADGPETRLSAQFVTSNSLARILLSWNAVTGAVYRVQTRDSLDPATTWSTIDAVTPTTDPATFSLIPTKVTSAPETVLPTGFYRLVVPQPEIFSVEPAIFPPGAPVDLYLVGQCFTTNDAVQIDGVAAGSLVFLDQSTLRVSLPAQSGGAHLVSLTRGGTTLSSFEVMCADASTLPQVALQEPPDEPPASPAISPTGKKGYDIWLRARGKMSAAQSNPMYEIAQPHSGEVQLRAVDLTIPGRSLDFVWARTYRSRTGPNTDQGNRWDFSYNIRFEQNGSNLDVMDGTGRLDTFHAQTNGTYSTSGFFREGTLSNGVFRLAFADTGFWEFDPLDGSPQAGKIARVQDRNGNALTFAYDGTGRLSMVVDDLGRTNTIAYGTLDGKISSVTDFSGRMVSYTYYPPGDPSGNAGDLKTVTTPPVTGTPNTNDFPLGKTTTFRYSTGFSDERENHLLLTVTDPKGQTPSACVYEHNQTNFEFLRCVAEQHGGSDQVITHAYVPQIPTPTNGFATFKCISNDRSGNVCEQFFDARNRLLCLREFTGRAIPGVTTTDTTNRPAGKLRTDDPDFFETRCRWNSDSLLAGLIFPRGGSLVMLYQSDFDPQASTRNRGDLRVLREVGTGAGADTDGDGLPDMTERTWRFDYDPRFGSPAIACRKVHGLHRGDMCLAAGRKGWDGTIKGNAFASFGDRGPRQTTSLDGTFTSGDRKGWDGTIKGNARKGWDGTIKGNAREEWEGTIKGNAFAAFGGRGPRQTTSLEGSYDKADRKGWDGTIKGNAFVDEDCDSFAINASDPLGHPTTCTYDSRGNRVKVKFFWDRAEKDYAYNNYGQLTAITNAPDESGWQRVDLATYYGTGSQAGYLKEWRVDAAGPTPLSTVFEYDAVGNGTRIVDTRGFDELFTYNSLDQVVAHQTPQVSLGSLARYTTTCAYDANDNVVEVEVENRDETGGLNLANPSWTTLYQYDQLNRCVRINQERDPAHNVTTEFQYDANDNLSMILSPESVNGDDPLNLVSFSYDERGLLFRRTRAPNAPNASTEQFDYDLNGNVERVTTGLNGTGAPPPGGAAVSFYTYDGFDRRVGVLDALGNVSTSAYDANGKLKYERFDGETNDVAGSALNRRLSERRYEYDSINRCTEVRAGFFDPATGLPIGKGEATTSFTYAPNSQLSSVTDDNRHTTRYSYDTAGRLSTVTDPKTNLFHYAYDPDGNLTNITEIDHSDLGGPEQDFTRTFAYDGLNRVILSSDNVQNTFHYAYDSRDNLVRQVDPRGNLTGSSYDGLNRLTLVIADLDGDGVLDLSKDVGSAQTWDDNSRLVASANANSNLTAYAYDSLNRCVTILNADHTQGRYAYDLRDNPISFRDPNGTVASNTFDLLDRCVRRDVAPGPGVAATTTFELFSYDGLGRLVLASNNASGLVFTYDSLGQRSVATQDGLAVTRVFDGVGNCLSVTYPSGRIVQYAYDGLNHLASINTVPAGSGAPVNLASFAFDGPGRLARVVRANSINTRLNWDGQANGANAAGDFGWKQLSRIIHARAGGTPVIDQRVFTYDQNQNKTVRTMISPWITGGPLGTNSFGYDPLNRLLTASLTWGTQTRQNDYSLDGNGNRRQVLSNQVAQVYQMSPELPEPADFQMDQYTLTPFGSEQHDRNGNRLNLADPAGPTVCHYDYADRLVEVDSLATGTLTPVATFAYDALGHRIAKTTYPPAPASPQTTQYVHGGDVDNDGVLEERQLGAMTRLYCWGQNFAGHDLSGDGVPDLLVAAFDPTGQAEYYHCDDLGNVLALTDAGGAVIERYDYDDYGAPSLFNANGDQLVWSPRSNVGLFGGMSWDPEIGLYYREARSLGYSSGRSYAAGRFGVELNGRYVEPASGRSLTRAGGPCANGACRPGSNPFTYAGDNPWSMVTAGKDKLKGTTKTQGDFNMANRFSFEIDGVMTSKSSGKTSGDFHQSSHFSVEIDAVSVAGSRKLAGLKMETEVTPYKHAESARSHTRPGHPKRGTLELKELNSKIKEQVRANADKAFDELAAEEAKH